MNKSTRGSLQLSWVMAFAVLSSAVLAIDCPNGYEWQASSNSCQLNCSIMKHGYPALNESSQCACAEKFVWNGTICSIDCASISNAGTV